tara:strand:- start:597 stop:1013 length:417 start_codon:yes stop_codon:yes gene_type:complete
MQIIEIPSGADYVASTIPNCGVVALAASTGHSISDITRWYRSAGKSTRWQGRLAWADLRRFILKNRMGWRSVFGARGTLKNFVDQHTATSTGRGYIVRVGGHFVAVTRGHVIDQMQSAPASEHWAANKRVSHAAEIVH